MRAPSLPVVVAGAFLLGVPTGRQRARPSRNAPSAPHRRRPWRPPGRSPILPRCRTTPCRTVRRGRDLIARTSSLIGPDAADSAMRYAGNGLDCQSCHLQAGTQQYGLPLAGIWGVFPTYIGRENEVRTLEERVNGCMEHSMNGRALPVDGPEMKAILTYIRYISGSERIGQSLHGRGSPALPLPLPERAADPERGQQVYAETCAVCHGADGQGQQLGAAQAKDTGRRYQFPPLWGPDSYNDGAGMARTITAARFVHANMPLGTSFEAPVLPRTPST